MNNNNNKFAYTIGRFNPFHLGHKMVVDTMVKDNEYCLILVGSANVCLTEKNPLTYIERASIIQSLYPNALVLPINDIGDDDVWIQSVKEKVNEALSIFQLEHNHPVNIYCGGISRPEDLELRRQWFEKPLGHKVVSAHCDTVHHLSATLVRKHWFQNDLETVKQLTAKQSYDIITTSQYHKQLFG